MKAYMSISKKSSPIRRALIVAILENLGFTLSYWIEGTNDTILNCDVFFTIRPEGYEYSMGKGQYAEYFKAELNHKPVREITVSGEVLYSREINKVVEVGVNWDTNYARIDNYITEPIKEIPICSKKHKMLTTLLYEYNNGNISSMTITKDSVMYTLCGRIVEERFLKLEVESNTTDYELLIISLL
jgi:hypothetical protein